MTTTAQTVAAHKLRPGQSIVLYGGPVYVTEAKSLPAFEPATHVQITYRKDYAEGTFVIGTTTVPAGVTFELYDDGSPF